MVFDSFTLAGVISSLLIAVFLIVLERRADAPPELANERAVGAAKRSVGITASFWFGCPRTAGQAVGADRA